VQQYVDIMCNTIMIIPRYHTTLLAASERLGHVLANLDQGNA